MENLKFGRTTPCQSNFLAPTICPSCECWNFIFLCIAHDSEPATLKRIKDNDVHRAATVLWRVSFVLDRFTVRGRDRILALQSIALRSPDWDGRQPVNFPTKRDSGWWRT